MQNRVMGIVMVSPISWAVNWNSSLTVATSAGQTTVSYNLSGNVGGKVFSIEVVDIPVLL